MTVLEELERVLDHDHAQAVIEHRKAIGKYKEFTPRAARYMAGEFEKTGDPNAAADYMLDQGWRGFKAEWMPKPPTQAQFINAHYERRKPRDVPEKTQEQRDRASAKAARLAAELARTNAMVKAEDKRRAWRAADRASKITANMRHLVAGRHANGG